MTAPFTADVRAASERSVLCWFATADASGQPNVTPQEVFAIVDEDHLVIANIASPGSAANAAANPKVLRALAGERFPIRSVFVVRATDVEAIVAPSYWLFPHETTEASQERAPLRAYGVVRVADGTGA